MAESAWYRSLYWRIAFGFATLLAVLLVVQGLIFLWMTGRMTDLFPGRSPSQLVASIAGDVSAALSQAERPDIPALLRERYSQAYRGFVVVLADGTAIESDRVSPPPQLARVARERLRRIQRGLPEPSPGSRDLRRSDRPSPAESSVEYAEIILAGEVFGTAAVPREPPPLSMALRALGPTLGAVALVLLVTGIAVAALLIGGPTRRRVRDLDRAARDIGLGRSGVRAAESGGDEVTALARTFNTMAAQLEERAQALEDADRTRRQLLADVSHELSTPLAAIRGYVETLTMPDVQLDEATRTRYLGIVTEEADRLSHIIGDLLDLARLEGGGGQLRVEEVPVALLFERVRHRHAKTATERGVVLDARVDGPETVSGDQNRLEQVLQNLVANALRHTPRGGVVTVRATRTGSGVTLSVRDTGSGIPAEHLPRIFDRFYKADQSRTGKDVPSGSGLGLSIVRAIATRHGGTISAHNADVGGAVFEVFLPSAGGEG